MDIINDIIIQVGKLSDDLCMFAAIYNSLRTFELRYAMAAGNINEPAKMFMKVSFKIIIFLFDLINIFGTIYLGQ